GALKSGESCTNTVTIDPCDCRCGTTVTIKVCADNDDDVEESNERNNCLENKLKCPECPCEKPDLTIIEKSEELDGNTLSVTYTIKNIGKVAACASTTCIYADGALLTTDTVGALKSGESCTNTVTIDPCDCRCGTTVTIKVCADNDDDVEESNERNNCLENNLKCLPCEKPDLEIVQKSEAWVSLDDKTYTIIYTVKNNGDGDAAASTTAIMINGVEVATDTVPGLASGESYSNTLGPFTMQRYCDTIEVCADSGDAVAESNEGNNCRRNTFCRPGPVTSADVPALTPFGAAILIGSLAIFAVANMRRRDE
ncbi:MAG: CARDB domain-containing protein, partial [Euryarchaeota archaeon]|nr:CARDB domain-containing protein [Euryarchaeota archaeon]